MPSKLLRESNALLDTPTHHYSFDCSTQTSHATTRLLRLCSRIFKYISPSTCLSKMSKSSGYLIQPARSPGMHDSPPQRDRKSVV